MAIAVNYQVVPVNPVRYFTVEIRSSRPLVSEGGEYGWTTLLNPWTSEPKRFTTKIKADDARRVLVTQKRVGRIVEHINDRPVAIFDRNARRHYRTFR